MVVGLFAFFIADAVPTGVNAVAVFFVAIGAVLLLFLVPALVSLILRRRSAPQPEPNRLSFRPSASVQWANSRVGFPAMMRRMRLPTEGSPITDAGTTPKARPTPEVRPSPPSGPVETVFADLLAIMGEAPGEDVRLSIDLMRYMSAPLSERPDALHALDRHNGGRQLREHLHYFARLFGSAPQAVREKLLNDLLRWMESR